MCCPNGPKFVWEFVFLCAFYSQALHVHLHTKFAFAYEICFRWNTSVESLISFHFPGLMWTGCKMNNNLLACGFLQQSSINLYPAVPTLTSKLQNYLRSDAGSTRMRLDDLAPSSYPRQSACSFWWLSSLGVGSCYAVNWSNALFCLLSSPGVGSWYAANWSTNALFAGYTLQMLGAVMLPSSAQWLHASKSCSCLWTLPSNTLKYGFKLVD